MPTVPYAKSPLEKWLRKKAMTTEAFIRMVKCSRPTIWKVKHGQPVCEEYAKRIIEITEGEVVPLISNIGRKKGCSVWNTGKRASKF